MKKTICKIIVVIMLIAFVIPIKSQAALQGNKGDIPSVTVNYTTIYANQLFTGIRAMEVGTIGKEAQDAKDGIDCHMVKNTEWGTAAMLSASVYGQAPTGNDTTATTTGNESGVYQMANTTGSQNDPYGNELVAGIWKDYNSGYDKYIGTIVKADSKYYDLYESATSKPRRCNN